MNDIAVLQYTGGTTGIPKGAALSHANIYINARQIQLWFHGLDRPETRIVGVLPLFHAFAMTCVMNLSLAFGACMLLEPRFEALKLLRLIARKHPNAMAGVPTLYNALLNTPGAEKFDLSSLNFCISGGAPLPLEVAKAFQAKTGARLLEGYGLSETSPVTCINPPSLGSKPGSIGLPVPGTICEIVSIDDGKTLMQPGETGEICFRGPQVMMGYWKRPDATAEVIIEGRLHTGDVGHIDEDGYVFITDRPHVAGTLSARRRRALRPARARLVGVAGASLELYAATEKLEKELLHHPALRDVTTDLQTRSPQVKVNIDRDKAAALSINAQQVENTLYDAYGPRWVSTIYSNVNEYKVLLELLPQFQQDPRALSMLYFKPRSMASLRLSASVSVVASPVGTLPDRFCGMGRLPLSNWTCATACPASRRLSRPACAR